MGENEFGEDFKIHASAAAWLLKIVGGFEGYNSLTFEELKSVPSI